jgi:hypothetical protein
MSGKLKTKCFQMPLIIYESLDENTRFIIRSRLMDCGHIRTVERLNRYMHREREDL